MSKVIPIIADDDARFFKQFPDRQVRIRKTRLGEQNNEFMTLGYHQPDRRRIIAWKVPKGSAFGVGRIVRIPFVQLADETIEDNDTCLMPILHSIMIDAAAEYGIPVPRMGKKNGH